MPATAVANSGLCIEVPAQRRENGCPTQNSCCSGLATIIGLLVAPERCHRMPEILPAIFFGHGNPMNAVLNNRYTEAWRLIGKQISKPKAILSISAHWFVPGTGVTISTAPRTIHDFGGFPPDLYRVQYPAPGAPDLARRVQKMLAPLTVDLDNSWGRHMPDPYDWAIRFESEAKQMMVAGEYKPLIQYEKLGPEAMLSIPTPDHYLPLLYVIATRQQGELITFPIEGVDGGSISMLTVQVG